MEVVIIDMLVNKNSNQKHDQTGDFHMKKKN